MKTFKFLACIYSLFIFHSLSSQTFDIKSFDLEEYGYSHSFTIKNEHFFTTSYSKEIIKVDKNNPIKYTKLVLEKDTKEESTSYISNINDQILMVTSISEEKKKPSSTNKEETYTTYFTTRINLYLFDVNGKKIKKVFQKVNLDDSFELDYRFNSDSKTIFLYQNKNVLMAYDYELNEKNTKTLPDYGKATSGSTYSFSDEMQDFMKQLSLQFDIKLDLDLDIPSKAKDTVSFENYAVSFNKVNKEAGIYKKYFTELTVHILNGKTFGKEVGIDLGSDKILTEAEFRILENGNILLFGRYKEKSTSTNCMYGMFTCVLNRQLDFVKDVQTNDLVRINSGPGNFDDRPYTGMFLESLHSPDNSFKYIDEDKKENYVFTFQKHFNNLIDHIYILRISSEGEMNINQIGNRTKVGKTFSNSYIAHMIKGNIVFFYYENVLNFNNKINDLNCVQTIPNKKTNVLVSCSYKIDSDDFTDKKKVSDIKTLKIIPNLNDAEFYFDETNSVHTMFCEGRTKKFKLKKMYMISFGE